MHNRTLLSYRFWRCAVAAAIYLALLAQMPALAAYTLGTWTEVAGPGSPWTVSGSGLSVDLTPQVGFTSSTETFVFAAPVTGSASNVTASTSNFNAFQVSGFGQTAGLTVSIGFNPSNNPSGNPANLIYSNAGNQFSTGTLPASLLGTYNSVNTNGYAVVKFVFTGPAVWGPTVPSSPVNITFTPGN